MTIRSVCSRAAPVVVVLAVLAVAGCRSGSRDGQPAVPLSPPARVSTSNTTPEGAVLAAYRGLWAAFVEAAKTSDPDAPDIRKYASDNALKLIVGGLVSNRDQGKVVKGKLVLAPTVPTVTSTEAKILDCVDATNWLEYKASGGLWDNKPGGKHRTTATMKMAEGIWKVNSLDLEGTGTC